MPEILSVLYILVFAASGFSAARFVLPKDRLMKQLTLGLSFGLVMLMWFPVLLAFLMSFNLAAQLIALLLAAGVGVLFAILGKGRAKTGKFSLAEDGRMLAAVLPIIVIGMILFSNHNLVKASNGSLHVGQVTYGDLCMHSGFITSISVQKTFPPMYSILPDTRLGYPFLCDSVSSTFYTLGSGLSFAITLPAVYAYVTVTLAVWMLFEDWFGSQKIAALATWLFFLGGGFGFWYFFDNTKTLAGLDSADKWKDFFDEVLGLKVNVSGDVSVDMQQRLMEGFYKVPTNFKALGLRWVNPIVDMLVPQRATLFGWALLFPSLQLLRRAALEKEYKLFIPLGVLAGAMPLVHTHSFFALGLISAFLILALIFGTLIKERDKADRRERWRVVKYFVFFGLIALALASPQLFGFTFRQSSEGGFVRKHLNWCNVSDGWLWFYIKNMGFIFLLMLPAFLFADGKSKLFYGGSVVIWILCEFVVFQPNEYDNNKLLFVWFLLTCGIVANFIVKVWEKLRRTETEKSSSPASGRENAGPKRGENGLEKLKNSVKALKDGKKASALMKRLAYDIVFFVLIASMFISGAMTIAREYASGDHIKKVDGKLKKVECGYEVVSAELCELADWINDNAEPKATFLTDSRHHNNAVAMLTGRNIVCGSQTFLYFHGVDYNDRRKDAKNMYENPSAYFYKFAEKYKVDYVVVGVWENYYNKVDEGWFRTNLEAVWHKGNTTLYRVGRK